MTTTTTGNDQSVRAPYLAFDLTGFINPRSTEMSLPWSVSIQDQSSRDYYSWQVTTRPTVAMSGTATARSFEYKRDSPINGALTNYNFTVVTMNYLEDGDTLTIDFPAPVYASVNSNCTGFSKKIQPNLPCKIAQNLSQVVITLRLPLRRVLEAEELFDEHEDERKLMAINRIESNESFTFQISGVKNPPSFKPTTDGFKYSVSTQNGFLIETSAFVEKLRVTNT